MSRRFWWTYLLLALMLAGCNGPGEIVVIDDPPYPMTDRIPHSEEGVR